MNHRRRGESGDPRKRNRADRKADRVRWQAEAEHAEIVELDEPPGMPGMVMFKVGPVLTIETRLLPGAPASVKARYRDRIRAAASGRCPACGEVGSLVEFEDGSTGRAQIAHDDDCPVLTLGEEQQWFDPRGISMDGSGIPVGAYQQRTRADVDEALAHLRPEARVEYESFRDQEDAVVRDMKGRLANAGHIEHGGTLRIGTQLHQLLDNALTVAYQTEAYCPHVDRAHPAPGFLLDHYRQRVTCVPCYEATWEPLPGDQEFRCDLCAELTDPDKMGRVITHVTWLLAAVSLCPSCLAEVEAGA